MSDGLNSINDLKVVITAETDNLSTGVENAKAIISRFSSEGSQSLSLVDKALGAVGTTAKTVQATLVPWLGVLEQIVAVSQTAFAKLDAVAGAVGMADEMEELKKQLVSIQESTGSLANSIKNISLSSIDGAKESALGFARGVGEANDRASGVADVWVNVVLKIEEAIGATRRFVETYDKISNRSDDTLRMNIEQVSKAIVGLDEKIAGRQNRPLVGPLELFADGTLESLDRQRTELLKRREELYAALAFHPKNLPEIKLPTAAPDEVAISPQFSAVLEKYKTEATALERKVERLDWSAVASARAAAEDRIRADAQAKGIVLTEGEEKALQRYLGRVEDVTAATEAQAEAKRVLGEAEKRQADEARAYDRDVQRQMQESDRAGQRIEDVLAGMDRETAAIQRKMKATELMTATDHASAAEEKALNALRKERQHLDDETIARIRAKAQAEGEAAIVARDHASQMKAFGDATGLVMRSAENAFKQFATTGRLEASSLREMLRQLLLDMMMLTIRQGVLQPMQQGAASLFQGFLAEGGPAAAGNAYVVGERGPEIFMPDVSGTVLSHERSREMFAGLGAGDRGRGGGPTVINLHTSINAAGAYPESIGDIKRALAEQQQTMPARVLAVVSDARERGGL